MTRVLVLGAAGQLGRALTTQNWPSDVDVIATDQDTLDITRAKDVERTFGQLTPSVAINLAAYTKVDRAESEREVAMEINAEGARHVAEAAEKHGAALIYVSTDYVFDGAKRAPYLEDDPAMPLNAYGATKLRGERATASTVERHVILRTSWLFGEAGPSFVHTMLELGRIRSKLSVVDDQQGCPTSARALAEAIARIAVRAGSGAELPWGTYHYSGRGETTWFRFAQAIFALAQQHGRTAPELRPITTAEYPTPAQRPLYSVLDCGRIERELGIASEPWEPDLAALVATLTR